MPFYETQKCATQHKHHIVSLPDQRDKVLCVLPGVTDAEGAEAKLDLPDEVIARLRNWKADTTR